MNRPYRSSIRGWTDTVEVDGRTLVPVAAFGIVELEVNADVDAGPFGA